MYLTSAEGYKNAGVHLLRVRKTGQIWVSMKNVHNGYMLKISDLILKDIDGRYGRKTSQKSKLKYTKWQKEKFMKSMMI